MEYKINNRNIRLLVPGVNAKYPRWYADQQYEYLRTKVLPRDDIAKNIDIIYKDNIKESILEIDDESGLNKYLGEAILQALIVPDRKEIFDFERERYSTKPDHGFDSPYKVGYSLQLSIRDNQYGGKHPVAVEWSGLMAHSGPVTFSYRGYNTVLLDPLLITKENLICEYWNIPFQMDGDTSDTEFINDTSIDLAITKPVEGTIYDKRNMALSIGYMAVLWETDKFLDSNK